MKYQPFHPILFAIHPVLFLYSQNARQFPAHVMLEPVLFLTSLVLIAMLLLWLFTSNRNRSFSLLSLSIVLFFSYGHIYSSLESSGISGDPKKALILYGALSALVVILAVWKIRDWKRANFFLNTTGTGLILLSMIGTVSSLDADRRIEREPVLNPLTAKAESPDIFFIILDGYPRKDILQKLHGVDNSMFLNALKSSGFQVLNQSRSNYAGTAPSLAATLNLAYLQDFVPREEIRSGNQWYLKQAIEQNRVMDFLKKYGYKTVAFDSGYFQTEIKNVDHFYATGWVLNEFHEALVDTTPAWILFKNLGRYEAQRKRILYILDHLPEVKDAKKPVFVFAHVMALHPPFVFGPNGEEVKRTGSSLQFWKQFGQPVRGGLMMEYQDQLTYINQKVVDTVEKILVTRNRPVCIVIQGDHGSSFESPENEKDYYNERFSILNAIRLPDSYRTYVASNLSDSMSSVNTFRFLFNALFHSKLPLLEDRSFYSTRSEPYRWKEVTAFLKKE